MKLFCFYLIFQFIYLVRDIECKGQLRTLDETSWSDMLEGEWMVEFFAPWCPACQQLQPLWEEFSKWSDDLGIRVGSVDVTLNPGLSGRFMITALPTIFHVKEGVFRQYRGSRDKDAFFSFVEEKKWQSVEAVSSWKSPQSLQMSTLAHFFKLSMLLRSLHTSLVQDYGVPYWCSYILFGLITIALGTILGLIIVCILDLFCRSRTGEYEPSSKGPAPYAKKTEKENEDEYEGEDVIREDSQEEEDEATELRQRNKETVAEEDR